MTASFCHWTRTLFYRKQWTPRKPVVAECGQSESGCQHSSCSSVTSKSVLFSNSSPSIPEINEQYGFVKITTVKYVYEISNKYQTVIICARPTATESKKNVSILHGLLLSRTYGRTGQNWILAWNVTRSILAKKSSQASLLQNEPNKPRTAVTFSVVGS